MSHYSGSYAPYSSRRQAPRWPWAFAMLIVVGLVAVSTLAIVDRNRDNQPPETDPQIAQLNVQPTPTPTPEPTAPPTAVDDSEAQRAAQQWIDLWSAKNYDAMYDMTTDEVQKATSREAFTKRYGEIATKAGITGVSGKIAGETAIDGSIPVDITIESSLVGPITERNTIPLVLQNGGWRVAWSPVLIFRALGDNGCIDFLGQDVGRGTIYDRSGNVLAEDAAVTRIEIVPADLVDRTYALNELSRIIDMPVSDIEALIDDPNWDPAWPVILKDIPGEPSVDLLNQIQPLKGVQVKRATTRLYPQGALTAHITGYVSPATQEDIESDETGTLQQDKMVGRSGLEYGANELLAGKPGGKLAVVECDTRAEREVIAESAGVPPVDIHTTIDLELQKQVDAALTAQVSPDKKEGVRSAAVVIDPQTGAVLAMVSHPSYDPNKAVNNTFSAAERKQINDDILTPQINRAADAQYPTGSIFKVITAAAGMHYLNYTGDTPINCPAQFSIGNQTWSDWVVENNLSAQGQLTLHSGLVRSCNTVFYQVGAALDDDDPMNLPTMARAFGLGSKTGIQYFPEVTGTVPDPQWKQDVVGDGWATGDAVNFSIGQGFMAATPLQMANAYVAIANGGTLLQPFIIQSTEDGEGKVTEIGKRTVIGELPLTDAQVTELQSALRDQTSNTDNVGSAKVFGSGYPFYISGKTGTAQNGMDPDSTPPHSWFAAYGSAEEGEPPTICSVVMVENVGEGVTYAAPATKQIYDWYRESGLAGEEP